MEVVIAVAAVAKGFSEYLAILIKSLDDTGPHRLTAWPGQDFLINSPGANGVTLHLDLVAMAAVLIVTLLLVIGLEVSIVRHEVGNHMHALPVTQCVSCELVLQAGMSATSPPVPAYGTTTASKALQTASRFAYASEVPAADGVRAAYTGG